MAAAEQSVDKTTTPFLLLVIGEPHTPEQKDLILPRIIRELSSWDGQESGCDLDAELQLLAAKAPVGEDGQLGEKIIEYQSDMVRIEVLVNPTLKTLTTRLRTFLLAPTTYRHLVHAGLLVRDTGCWLMQDGTFGAGALADLLRGTDVINAAKQGTILGSLCITAHAEGDWSESYLSRAAPSPLVVRLNREASGTPTSGFVQFGGYISSFLRAAPLSELLPVSGVVGNIRFSRPTIYVFPGSQGDSCLFGVSGFSLLVDGGYARRSCFWDFTRHLDRIDAMLVSHVGIDNILGLASFAERKARDSVHPEIGHVLMNSVDSPRASAPPTDGGDASVPNGHKPASLIINVAEEALNFTENLKKNGLVINKCVGGIPTQAGLPSINLYHKVGHGSLDLYVLNPTHDSRPLKEFLAQWSRNGNGFGARGNAITPANAASICALLVWRPSSPNDMITRILFPGNTPQSQIFESLDRMKMMPIFQHASCAEKDVSGKSGTAIRKPTAQKAPAAAAPPPKAPTAAPPSSTPIPKPASLPVAAKSEKVEAKKPTHSAAAPKKITSPTKPASKEVKKAHKEDAAHAVAPPAHSPSDSQHSQEKPDDLTPASAEAVSPVAAADQLIDTSPAVGDGFVAVEERPAEVAALESSPPAMDGGSAAVGDLVDLQAVPEPHDHGVDDLADEPQSHSEASEIAVESPKAAAAAEPFHEEDVPVKSPANIMDDDKDIDTAEVLAAGDSGAAFEQDIGGTDPVAPVGDLLGSEPFDGELPDSLPAPAAVTEESILARHDSLEDVSVKPEAEENLPIDVEPIQPNPEPFNVTDLGAAFDAQASTNPFLGISDTDPSIHHGLPDYASDLAAAGVYEDENAVPAVAEPVSHADDSRDSLEREPLGLPEFDPQSEWGHPMSLPAPNKPAGKTDGDKKPEPKKAATSPTKPAARQPAAKKDEDEKHAAPKKTTRPSTAPGDASKTEPPKSARTQPAAKKPQSAAAKPAPLKSVVPFYVDLAYIPAHGSAEYVGFDFFRRVRARYYVLSTISPDPATLGALLDAKATWDDPEAEVTIIPTYDADVLRYWMGAHRDQMSAARVDVAPSANRCTIQLQDHDTGCSAYRLEF